MPQQLQSDVCLVVTNPLHYTYLRQRCAVPAIGSQANTLFVESASDFGFAEGVKLFPVVNNIEEIIRADQVHAKNRRYFAWKAADVPCTLLNNEYGLAHELERKSVIRRLLPADLFPGHVNITAAEMPDVRYDTLTEQLGSKKLVLQVDFSTGGKGTHVVADERDFEAIKPELIDSGQSIVASVYIDGVSRGVQCLISGGRVYHMNWWHKDLVSIADVCNMDVPGATRYCGAVLENIPNDSVQTVRTLVETVGEKLAILGYVGVFGIDIVVEAQTGRVFLIEVNPRFTAVSHVYATAMHAVGYNTDFLTTAVLDALNVGDDRVSDYVNEHELPAKYSYLKIQNTAANAVHVTSECRLGVYGANGYRRFGFGVQDITSDDDVVVIPEGDQSVSYAPGARMFSIICEGDAIDGLRLTAKVRQRLDELREQFTVMS